MGAPEFRTSWRKSLHIIRKVRKLFRVLTSRNMLWLKALLRFRVAPSTEHLTVLRNLQVDTFIDIGANRGQFSLAATYMFPESTIFSFEPLPSARRVYDLIFESKDAVHIFEFAIGNQAKENVMHISRKEDSSSLLEISQRQVDIFPGTDRERITHVQVRRLGDCINSDELGSNTFLKIDVQGYELEVLLGASELLSYISYVYVECSFVELYKNQATASQVIGYLVDNSFTLSGIYNVCYDTNGLAVQADFFFLKENLCT